jgi:hypothetical protein
VLILQTQDHRSERVGASFELCPDYATSRREQIGVMKQKFCFDPHQRPCEWFRQFLGQLPRQDGSRTSSPSALAGPLSVDLREVLDSG